MTHRNQPPHVPYYVYVPYYVKGLALGVPIFLAAIHFWTWVLFAPTTVRAGRVDFRQSYAAAYMLRTGHQKELYDYFAQKKAQDAVVSPALVPLPFVAPAYEALLLEPLSFFKFRTAYCLFVFVSVLGVGACFLVLRRWMTSIALLYWWLPVALFIGFLPLAAAMVQGQDSVCLTLALAIAYLLTASNKNFLAGIVLGLALFKFSIVIPIVLLFVIWQRWRFLAGFFLSCSVVTLTCVAATGASAQKQYVYLILSLASLHHPPVPLALYPVQWNLMANLHGLIYGCLHRWLSDQWVAQLAMLASALMLAWVAHRGRRVKDTSVLLLIAIPAAILVSHHTYIHDLSPLVIPIIVSLNHFLPNEALPAKSSLEVRGATIMFVAPVVFCYVSQDFWIVSLAILAFLYSLLRADFNQFGDPETKLAWSVARSA